MKKQIYATILSLSIIFLLTGCNTQQTANIAISPQPSQKNEQVKPISETSNKATNKSSIIESYKPYLVIHDIKINDYKGSAISNDQTFIVGYVKNTGDKTIKKLEVTIYYLDSNDKPMSEDKRTTILEGDNSYSDPIKPNYESKFVAEVAEGVRKAWAHKITVEISNIEFVDG